MHPLLPKAWQPLLWGSLPLGWVSAALEEASGWTLRGMSQKHRVHERLGIGKPRDLQHHSPGLVLCLTSSLVSPSEIKDIVRKELTRLHRSHLLPTGCNSTGSPSAWGQEPIPIPPPSGSLALTAPEFPMSCPHCTLSTSSGTGSPSPTFRAGPLQPLHLHSFSQPISLATDFLSFPTSH